jgi:hypothetical protein
MGKHSSPWEFGGGLRLAPGWAINSVGLSAHPLGGYSYLSFDGGWDGLLEVGGQVRQRLMLGSRPAWVGAEAGLTRLTTHIDGVDDTFNANGILGGLVAGLPVGQNRWGTSLYAGAGVLRFEGNVGTTVRIGVDVQPWFLNRQ